MGDLIQTAIGNSSQIRLELAADLWSIRTNISQLESSLLNIALNARDAAGSVMRLIIKTENLVLQAPQPMLDLTGDTAKKYVRLSVSDNGCGMTEEMMDKIFTPFFTTKKRAKARV